MAGIDGVYMDMVSAPSAVMAATSSVMARDWAGDWAEDRGFDMWDVIGVGGDFAKCRGSGPASGLNQSHPLTVSPASS
jgi:hypothetical protein